MQLYSQDTLHISADEWHDILGYIDVAKMPVELKEVFEQMDDLIAQGDRVVISNKY